MWFKRIGREWVVLSVALIGAAFSIGDGAGWIEFIFGYKPPQEWVYSGVFILFAIIAIYRLVKLQAQIDESKERIRLIAHPGAYAINLPRKSEEPLGHDEISINTTIHFEIWTDIDVNTAKLVLNIVGVRHRDWWQPWKLFLPKKKRMLGLRIDGHDDPTYRKQIKCADAQPFEDNATFKWRGKRDILNFGDSFYFELALETGSPIGIWRAIADPRLYERGVTMAL